MSKRKKKPKSKNLVPLNDKIKEFCITNFYGVDLSTIEMKEGFMEYLERCLEDFNTNNKK